MCFGVVLVREKQVKAVQYIGAKFSVVRWSQVEHPGQREKKVECDRLSENLEGESTGRSK